MVKKRNEGGGDAPALECNRICETEYLAIATFLLKDADRMGSHIIPGSCPPVKRSRHTIARSCRNNSRCRSRSGHVFSGSSPTRDERYTPLPPRRGPAITGR